MKRGSEDAKRKTVLLAFSWVLEFQFHGHHGLLGGRSIQTVYFIQMQCSQVGKSNFYTQSSQQHANAMFAGQLASFVNIINLVTFPPSVGRPSVTSQPPPISFECLRYVRGNLEHDEVPTSRLRT